MRHVTSLYFNLSVQFIKCFKNSILLSKCNRTYSLCYNPDPSYSWITVLQIYMSGILGILFCSLLVYGSHKKNTTCLIAWIILHLMNIIWGFIENLVKRSFEVSGIEFLWIILSIPLIDIVWRAKKQIDNEDMKQPEEDVI